MTVDTLDEAIHVILADGPLRSREIAVQINRRKLWIRPSDGQPVRATQVAARVRLKTYRDQFTIGHDGRISSKYTSDVTDEDQERLRAAIGQAVLSAASLEHTLRMVIMHQRGERDGAGDQLARFMLGLIKKPGGRLLGQLKSLGLDADLVERIRDVMHRRNRMIHHHAEDKLLLLGLIGRDADAAVAYVQQIAADCDAIVAETQAIAVRGALNLMGATPEQLEDWFRNRDLDAIEDDGLRETLVTLRSVFV